MGAKPREEGNQNASRPLTLACPATRGAQTVNIGLRQKVSVLASQRGRITYQAVGRGAALENRGSSMPCLQKGKNKR